MVSEIRVQVDSPYSVLIGGGALSQLAAQLPADAARHAVLYAPAVSALAAEIGRSLDALMIELPDSESAKSLDTLGACWDALGAAGFTRNDCLITVGGGATTDVGGFVAATWLRGISVVHVPTTLLGMVDAAVGGKTGINTSAGKNLVGAFHHPVSVICDTDTLRTLPKPELLQGLAEVVKCGFIADNEILALLEAHSVDALVPGSDVLADLITRAIAVKAEVVADDFRERKTDGIGREMLNYGHTLGHAIERREQYVWRHGHAISVGMVFVAELARLQGRIDDDVVELHRSLLAKFGLPISYEPAAWVDLRAAMDLDKKSRGSTLRLVVLESLQQPTIVCAPDEGELREAYDRVCR